MRLFSRIICLLVFTILIISYLASTHWHAPTNQHLSRQKPDLQMHVGAAPRSNRKVECPLPWKSELDEEDEEIKPLVKLDKNKFLLPMLINGPNNQLVGFRKTLFVAIRLNRTIVIPTFHKHKSDV